MSPDNTKTEKKKVALTQETYDVLKAYSRLNGLKLRLVIDSMVEVLLADEVLSKRIFEMTLNKQSGNMN